ncbi:hypothetical protein Leryth_006615 [Lithospermum erythrorhizon]|nr:hypothetical protein Leryth_006615 [Lithospermum erythrorhizon]
MYSNSHFKMELELSLSLSNNNNKNSKMMKTNKQEIKKRCYSKAFDGIDEEEVNSSDVVPKTLSLFVWKANNNGDEDRSDNNPRDHTHSSIHLNKNDEEKGVIGWPPLNKWRKKICYYNLAGNILNNYEIRVENGGGNNVRRNGDGIYGGRNPKSMYVKVKMEGVGIARKIDLTAHHSFQALTDSLMLMFGTCNEKNKGYKLTYEAKDGAWLLAGDQPWGSFVQTVQRLKLLKNGDKI